MIQDTLNERAKTYGDFRDIARISGALQRAMRAGRNWDNLPEDAREALQAIASKIARILNGDPEHIDNWHDISGYATLVENRLHETSAKIAAKVAELAPPSSHAPDLAIPPTGVDVWYSTDQGASAPWYATGPKGSARAATRDAAVAAVV